MALFNNGLQSHAHSLTVLDHIRKYDDFLDTITTVADMGCGNGHDINWWSRLEYLEISEDSSGNEHENWRKRNYICYAVDRDIKQIETGMLPDNVHAIEGDFEKRVLSRAVDFMWSHDSFQYALNPLNTLKVWNEQMNENGMLCITIPQQNAYVYNRLVVRSHSHAYFNHNFLSLVYMLAVNGFDCRDAYFLKERNDAWLHAAVYKSNHAPMDPSTTTWHDLAEKRLINDSMINSVDKYGYVKQEDILCTWFDGNWHKIED